MAMAYKKTQKRVPKVTSTKSVARPVVTPTAPKVGKMRATVRKKPIGDVAITPGFKPSDRIVRKKY